MGKRITIALGISIALMLWSAPSLAQAPVAIDPRVLEDTANGKIGNFLIVLKTQTPTRTIAERAPNRAERGRAVFDALRETARVTQPALRAQLEALGANYHAYYVANVIAAEGNRAAVDAMAARGDVIAIESDRPFYVSLETAEPFGIAAPATVEWNISKVNPPGVWAQGYTGQNRVYANADTGVQWDHPALKPQYRGWNGTSADHNFNWWDAVHSDHSGNGTNPCGFSIVAPCDDFGHGTHTMGTGIGNDGAGNSIGMAPGAKWIACRNMDEGWGSPSTYIECMNFFLAPTDLNGNNPNPALAPDAVGNSYTCPPAEGCVESSLLIAVNNMRSAGIFMSISAGNSGSGCSTINEPPSHYDSAITIGATDQNDNIAGFSSRGPITIDGSNRRKPDLVAPGVNVRSSERGNVYGFMSGTSMASPHVAGAVVLLWSAFPNLRRQVDLTEQILESNAVHLTTTQGCGGDSSTVVPNNIYGYGRLDVLAAYNYVVNNPLVFKYLFPLIFR